MAESEHCRLLFYKFRFVAICLIMDEKLRENDEYLKNLHKLEPKNELPHLPDACKFYAKGILSLLKQFIVRILTIIG